jgi:AraC-like DNA-binding protein
MGVSFERLLDLCFAVKIPLVEFLTTCPPQPANIVTAKLEQLPSMSSKRGVRLSKENKELVKQALDKLFVEDDTTLPALYQIANKLHMSRSTLRKHFPDHCRVLETRHKRWDSVERQELMQQMLKDALASEDPSSLTEIAWRLGCMTTVLTNYFPNLCTAITNRYRNYHSQEQAAIQINLQEALAKTEPILPVSELADQMGYSRPVVWRKCPQLCSLISKRYLEERRKRGEKRKEDIRQEIRRHVLDLHQQGKYPSSWEIKKRSGKPNLMREPGMSATWKAALNELGYV